MAPRKPKVQPKEEIIDDGRLVLTPAIIEWAEENGEDQTVAHARRLVQRYLDGHPS